MIHTACAFLSLLFCATPIVTPPVSPAGEVFVKERTADDLYGRGVHAYHANDYDAAKKLLEEVERLESTDPRPYFFLGLTLIKLDKKREADDAFSKAASLEWESRTARDYGVSTALIRVQGEDRVYLEKFRADARSGAADAAKRDHANRFGNQPAPTDVTARRTVSESGDQTQRQTAVKFSPIWFRPARPFVAKAAFGARSIDPFRAGYDDNRDNVIGGAVATTIAPSPAPVAPAPAPAAVTPPTVSTPPTPEPAQVDDDPFK